jgi:uncharacterized membrane-anchored protein
MSVGEARRPAIPVRAALSKVPEITALFWIIKVLTTGMGETTSDYLTHRFDPVVAVGLVGVVFVVSLILQLKVDRYRTGIYWFAIVMVSVFGTMAADVLHVGLGIPYIVSTIFYAAVLMVIFVLWYASEKTLSIHSIRTRRRELFYWATVLATFALGTAAGDLTASTLKLGYFTSGVLFAIAFAIPAIACRLGANPVLTFWAAYVLTRPFGASFADWLGVPPNRHGLNLGTGAVSVVAGVIIVLLVIYLGRTERRTGRHAR